MAEGGSFNGITRAQSAARSRSCILPSLPATNAKRLRKGANGSRECAPDDRLRDEAIHSSFVVAVWIASLTLAMTV
jgi:hypothetical protein